MKCIRVAGAAWFPYSEALQDSYSRIDAYEETFNLSTKVNIEGDDFLLVPRNLVEVNPYINQQMVGEDCTFTSSFIARDEQQEWAVNDIADRLKQGRSFVVCAPTGLGKTVMCLAAIAMLGKKTLIVVTKEDIKEQWIEEAKAILGLEPEDIGLIQGTSFNTDGKSLVIATIQTLSKLDKHYFRDDFKQFGLCVWDETHRIGADHFCKSAYQIPARLRLGLSATPNRKDGKNEFIQAHICQVEVTLDQLNMIPKILIVKTDWKVPTTLKKTPNGTALKPMYHTFGRTMGVEKFFNMDKVRNAQIIKALKACYEKGRNVIVFSSRRLHLKDLYELACNAGIDEKNIALYAGGLTPKQREEAKKKQILFATYAFTSEATNIPRLDTAILASPRADVIQIIGRILRTYKDKPEPVVFDFVDNDSHVFKAYAKSREKWYHEIGASVSCVKM